MTDTPAARLEALELAAFNGETVTAAELAEAREEIRLEKIREAGAAARVQEEGEREAERRREQVKQDVAEMLDIDDDATFLAALDTAVASLSSLIDTIDGHNQRLTDAAAAYDRAGVSAASAHHPFPDGVDSANHALMGHGLAVVQIVAVGRVHTPQNATEWLASAVRAVVDAHAPRLKRRTVISSIESSHIPLAVRNRQ